ncbi:MAG: pyrimidine dimer DNA glycosylase/endonuclease V [Steroidobacteraceae bacterium]
MRLWSLHPQYLDARGLVALWREALLAQAVLRGRTRGYRSHPQLQRFRQAPAPRAAIAGYLREIQAEGARRGYRFDARKIGRARAGACLQVTRAQLRFELTHLRRKLSRRAPAWRQRLPARALPRAHPAFRTTRGGVATWEIR